jgi:hypothetical protein
MKRYEIIVAAFGIAVTAILGFGQWSLVRQQNNMQAMKTIFEEKRGIDDIEIRTMAMISPYLGSLGDQSDEGKRAVKVVVATAEFLSNKHERTSLAEMAYRILELAPLVEQSVKTRMKEATQKAPILSPWFTVLASLPGDQPAIAREVAKAKYKLINSTDNALAVQLYKTKISKHYAVVVGGPLTNDEAVSLARKARESGWAKDAFAQKDREWSKIGDAPFKE